MNKVNIANYVVFDLSNRFIGLDNNHIDNEIIKMIADNWHKKHSVSNLNKNVKYNHRNTKQSLLM
jgi:hypothetical protein